MSEDQTLAKLLQEQGVSRRGFLKFCAGLATMMALPASMAPTIAEALENAKRPSVIWLSFQECTGCTESLTRSHSPTLENLIFDVISLDYHHTLMAPSGTAAEDSRLQAIKDHHGKYLLVVDGSIPIKDGGVYSTIAGISNLDMLKETAEGAAAIISVGTCAAYGGLPYADPNPTGAVSVSSIIRDKPIINIPDALLFLLLLPAYWHTFSPLEKYLNSIALADHYPFMVILFTTVVIADLFMIKVSLPKHLMMKVHVKAGVYMNSVAKAPLLIMPVPLKSGIKAPVFQSSQVMVA